MFKKSIPFGAFVASMIGMNLFALAFGLATYAGAGQQLAEVLDKQKTEVNSENVLGSESTHPSSHTSQTRGSVEITVIEPGRIYGVYSPSWSPYDGLSYGLQILVKEREVNINSMTPITRLHPGLGSYTEGLIVLTTPKKPSAR